MSMEMYQHDSAARFRFVLRGALAGEQATELEHAWTTAESILTGKELVVDLSGLTGADESGVSLLSRMRAAGAQLTAAPPFASKEFLGLLGVPVVVPSGRFSAAGFVRLLCGRVFRRRVLESVASPMSDARMFTRGSRPLSNPKHPVDARSP